MNIERIKLYHFPLTRSARVKWLLHELVGDDFDVEPVALYQGEQYQPEYLSRNPNHAVPVLDFTLSDGSVFSMIESGAMIAFLADIHPDKALAPPPDQFSTARADYLQMLHFGTSWMDMMLWQLRLHHDLFSDADRDDRTIARFKEKFASEVEPQLEARLSHTEFVCGDRFTAADCVIGHNVMWGSLYGLCTGEALVRYVKTLSTRPAYQAAFADRDQFTRSPS